MQRKRVVRDRKSVASIFSGIGGFDLGFERAGFKIVLQVEVNSDAASILKRNWPKVVAHSDVREVIEVSEKASEAYIICGGDPCPSRSVARGGWGSKHPDLAGYFLALVGRSKPRWVVRENVPSPDIVHFAAALEALGYRVVAFSLDARDFTSQSRRRQFCIGCPSEKASRFAKAVSESASAFGNLQKDAEEENPIAACITTSRFRMAAHDTYCYEEKRGLRVLSIEECEALQGFPIGWTSGVSESKRQRLIGNAVPPPMIQWIASCLTEVGL